MWTNSKCSLGCISTTLCSCSRGEFFLNKDAGGPSCNPCPQGRYKEQPVIVTSSSCDNMCSAGRWSDETGLRSDTQCKGCPAGKWSAETGHTSATQCVGVCPAGRWSDETGLSSGVQCAECPAGRWSNLTGSATIWQCTECAAGMVSLAGPGQSSVSSCSDVCPAGRWSDVGGLTSQNQCKGCPAGTWSAQVSLTAEDQCENECSPGRWSDVTGISADSGCQVCPDGKYSAQAGSTSLAQCSGCPAGTAMTALGPPPTCTACPAGTFQPDLPADVTDTSICQDCPAGQYQNDDGDSAFLHDSVLDCLNCSAGRQFASPTTMCSICAAGRFQGHDGTVPNASCLVCPTGRTIVDNSSDVVEHLDLANCSSCTPGMFSNDPSIACAICPGGYFTEATIDVIACVACAPGKFIGDKAETATEHDNAKDCDACPEGQVSRFGASFCENCPMGWVLPVPCFACAPGLWQNGIMCQECSPGHYQPANGTAFCLPW